MPVLLNYQIINTLKSYQTITQYTLYPAKNIQIITVKLGKIEYYKQNLSYEELSGLIC